LKTKTYFISILYFYLLTVTAFAANADGYIVKIAKSKDFKMLNSASHKQIADGICVVRDENELNNIKSQYDIEYIEPNYEVTLFAAPDDPFVQNQWNLQMIGAEKAWELGCYGNNIKIGVIDSGLYEHDDIRDNKLNGYNYLNDSTDVTDNMGHGTAVSGIIAAQWNDIGIAGIAHRAQIVPLKCFDDNIKTYVDTIILAINDAMNKYDCDIVNMSFGMPSNSAALESVINEGILKGVIFIASVGNDGNSQTYYPAGYGNVIGVGSVNKNSIVSDFSQRNNSVFVTAPGEMIISLGNNNSYIIADGTSFSAPTVTGAIAALKNIDNNINTETVKSILSQTSTDLGETGYDIEYGYGLIDIGRIISKMLENHNIFVSPIDYYNGVSTVLVYNNSGSDISATGIFTAKAEDIIVGIQNQANTIKSKAVQSFSFNFNGKTTFYLWDSISNLQPLYYKIH
jgi:subtilisin family serine protease